MFHINMHYYHNSNMLNAFIKMKMISGNCCTVDILYVTRLKIEQQTPILHESALRQNKASYLQHNTVQ